MATKNDPYLLDKIIAERLLDYANQLKECLEDPEKAHQSLNWVELIASESEALEEALAKKTLPLTWIEEDEK